MKKRKKFDQINVIPFIDIMLVLLVMVLTTATFIKQGIIPVTLPNATNADTKEQKKELSIYVTKDGKIYLDKKELDREHLELELRKVDNSSQIVLRSDKEAEFQNFVTVMDILKKLEMKQLYIVTKK